MKMPEQSSLIVSAKSGEFTPAEKIIFGSCIIAVFVTFALAFRSVWAGNFHQFVLWMLGSLASAIMTNSYALWLHWRDTKRRPHNEL